MSTEIDCIESTDLGSRTGILAFAIIYPVMSLSVASGLVLFSTYPAAIPLLGIASMLT